MYLLRIFSSGCLLTATLLLAACGGGGGGGGGSGTAGGGGTTTPPPATGLLSALLDIPNLFLLFPNPQKQDDATLQTNTISYASAYYAAIDPTAAKSTKAGWMTANGFGSGTGSEITVVFGDQHDLGYGRRMTARKNADGTLAFMVENYQVSSGGAYTYSHLNVDAAVVQSAPRYVNTSASEYSPSPSGGPPFLKFYNFAPDGGRNLMVNQDGLGLKAMPNICVSCHGGRGDPLTSTGAFATVGNGFSQKPGDTTSRLQPLKVSTFDFSALDPTFTRGAQEANIKIINQWILATYPLAAATAFAEDATRPIIGVNAGVNEWKGDADRLIKDAYGGDGMPGTTYVDPPVPTAWASAGQTTLYQEVVAPRCVTCHVLRGTANQSDVDFDTYAKFFSYSDRIKAHVLDRGNMPLAKIVFDDFWAATSPSPNRLAAFLEDPSQVPAFSLRDGSGNLLLPGRPLADPGPDRTLPQGNVSLSGANSLYSTGYSWSIISENGGALVPGHATLTGATTATPTFDATINGNFVVRLITTSSAGTSTPVDVKFVVNNAIAPLPSAIRFSDIKVVFTADCATSCHVAPLTNANKPPISYDIADYGGDDVAFYSAVRGRINFTDISASALLRKPSGHHHGGNLRPGFDITTPPGDPARANYDIFLNWILNGAPRT